MAASTYRPSQPEDQFTCVFIRTLAILQARKRSGKDFRLVCAWASSPLTDIHHQGHSPGKDVKMETKERRKLA
jgi:hypothetical protein